MFELNKDYNQLDNIEMRKVYANKLEEFLSKDKRVVGLEADLMGAIGTSGVQKKFPDRLINCGIMEANMIGVAAGLSLTGKLPIAHTFTAFATRRCLDQIFMSSLYQNLPIKVIASDSGITALHNGGTHMSFEDMGLIRGLARSTVIEVTDATMFANVLDQIYDKDNFYFIRLARKNAYKIYADNSTFEIGKANLLRDGNDVTIIANGIMVRNALLAADMLEKEGISAAVIDMFTLKPIDKDIIEKYANKTGKIVTCENHSIQNGLYSAVSEVVVEKGNARVKAIGINNEYGQVGTLEYLMEQYKLRPIDIVNAVKSF